MLAGAVEAQGQASLRVTGCLSDCDDSNSVVVVPTRPGRRNGGRPTWFGGMLDDDSYSGLADWVTRGGPGLADLPAALAPRLVDRLGAPSASS